MAFLVAAVLLIAAPACAKSRADRLAERLGSSRGEERVRLVTALGRTDSDDAVAPLIKLFQFRKAQPGVSIAIVRSLGRLGRKDAVGPLMECWDHLESLRLRGELTQAQQRLRAAVVEAFGLIKDKKAAPLVLASVADEDPGVVRAGVLACGRLKERKAVDPLIGLAGADPVFIPLVYEALAEIGDSRARPVLERGAKDDDPFAAAAASYGLVRMGDRGSLEVLKKAVASDQTGKPELMAAFYLARLDEDAGVDKLVAVLSRKDSPLAETAAEHLAQAGNRRAVGPAADLLENSQDPGLRLLCVRVLAGVGGPKAVHALFRAAKDSDAGLAKAARAALSELGEED
ncbi:MAG: HEAT repeat domain-containing protein [Elusimicrobia bacterium]|nr:HEAT repeat domain-containing protein [Elusimicrobiota bacterium]